MGTSSKDFAKHARQSAAAAAARRAEIAKGDHMDQTVARQPIYSRDLERKIPQFVDNIISLFELATAEELEDGRTWYRRAGRFIAQLAEDYSRTIADVAGIMSVLSPSTTIEQNVIDLVNVMAERDLYDDVTVGTYGPQYLKALKIRDLGVDPAEVLGQNKTAAFFANLVNPSTAGRVTVDRHAARVAAGWNMAAEDAYYYVNTPKKYSVMERAYKIAAARLGLLPHELQAVTWLTYRRLFVAKKRNDSNEVIPF